ncbi:MAG: serine/threonine dehydratase [Alphaproteobacteria bacterium]|nr:serine/threonine dehydratase [Alphaproteobacteria bacterium]
MDPQVIRDAQKRISPFLHRTPILESARLNDWLGHRVRFKMETFQKAGAFKSRGALNALLALKEAGKLPSSVVAYSSGNHAQGVAWAAAALGIPARIYLPKIVSAIKQQATRAYGAEVIITPTRVEAEEAAKRDAAAGAFLLPPYDLDDVIAGQGTACLEALEDGEKPDAIFAPIGGGGLLSGTWLAKQLLYPQAEVWGAEPFNANDAARSLREGNIFRWPDSPKTLADGARTLAVSPRTFAYLQRTNGIVEITESELCYWAQWLAHLLKCVVEPTSAMAMAAAARWGLTQKPGREMLVIISGGNVAAETMRDIWKEDMLLNPPLTQFLHQYVIEISPKG